jgi:hypothetical protein
MAEKSYLASSLDLFDRGLQVGQDDEQHCFDVNYHQ